MLRRIRSHDPFWDDGVGAKQRNRRVVIEGFVAFGLSIVACGLTVALWLRMVASLVGPLSPL